MSYVTATAQLQCPFGTAPGVLIANSQTKVMIQGKPAATIQDAAPIKNIPPFAMCTTQTNPAVAAATAAALGTPTPAPCVPATTTWIPGSKSATRTFQGIPCLTNDCKCMCQWGGVISITNPGQTKVN
ncbi:MAG: DUF4280 domain-containing protein [Lachnospiraceae bacterium]|nr:DUF4280 domain-containing protein [Lachnospiraceae bacterium]